MLLSQNLNCSEYIYQTTTQKKSKKEMNVRLRGNVEYK